MEMNPVIEHLKKEIDLFKEFISVLQKETENIVGRDYKGLYDTVGLKEHLITRIETAGGLRAKLIGEAAEALGVKNDPSLTALIEKTSGVVKDSLKECQSTLLTLLDSVMEISRLNAVVVRESLDNINKTLGFLGNFMPATVYNPAGSFAGSYSLKGSRLSEGA
jgi:flagellar biosynthesis/type III secretory pathway chaperone